MQTRVCYFRTFNEGIIDQKLLRGSFLSCDFELKTILLYLNEVFYKISTISKADSSVQIMAADNQWLKEGSLKTNENCTALLLNSMLIVSFHVSDTMRRLCFLSVATKLGYFCTSEILV